MKKQNTFKTEPINEKILMKSVLTVGSVVILCLFVIVVFYLAIILGK